jgi:hypothetical protein
MHYPISPGVTRRRWFLFSLIHLAVLVLIACAFLWRGFVDLIPPREPYGMRLSGCVLHDIVHIYCPLCGGTRAIVALCRGQLLYSLQCNPVSAYLAVGFVVFDVIAAVRITRRSDKPILHIPRWYVVVGIALAVLVFIVRNALLIGYCIDNLDSLSVFW